MDVDGPVATVTFDGKRMTRRLRWLPDSTMSGPLDTAVLGSAEDFFIGSYIGAPLTSRIRGAGAWFADGAGNVYVRAPGLLIDVRGRPRSKSTTTNQPKPHRNLMSGGRAQVVFALLTWPDLLGSPPYLAKVAGVSRALAYSTLVLLEEARYVVPGAGRLERRNELLDLWATAYPLGLGRKIELGRFVGQPDPTPWADLGHRVYVSGEYAAPGLHGPDLTLYVPKIEPLALRGARWHRPQGDETPNIVLRHTFWTEPAEIVTGPEVREAPALLVYADLLASNDPRQRGTAREMRENLG